MSNVRLCRRGNTCPYSDCAFSHPACSKGKGCSFNNNRLPLEGGCRFDHRDSTVLVKRETSSPISNERELFDKFIQFGLEWPFGNVYDTQNMEGAYRDLLVRTLKKSSIEFIDHTDWMEINFENSV